MTIVAILAIAGSVLLVGSLIGVFGLALMVADKIGGDHETMRDA